MGLDRGEGKYEVYLTITIEHIGFLLACGELDGIKALPT